MNNTLKLKRGLDLRIKGAAAGGDVTPAHASEVAVTPDDFPGFVPKLEVREGDEVLAGQPLLHDKNDEDIKLCSPVSGTVAAVVRGERRKIERVVVKPSAQQKDVALDVSVADAQGVIALLKHSGLWAFMRQRPYDIVPKGNVTPRDIFVTAFDSAPLAPDFEAYAADRGREIAAAVEALAKVTSGKVYISTRTDSNIKVSAPAVHVTVEGPHPAGNAGVQAANIAPVNKGETIWTLDIITLCHIGEVILNGHRDYSTVVAVTGPEVEKPCLVKTVEGADIKSVLAGDIVDDGRHHRIISGNVLTGVKTGMDGYLRFPYRQVTVIAEGDDVDEFMGWASMSPSKMSVSRAFPFKGLRRLFSPDARLNGGRRAMIMSGEYDKVMPMDILPEYLIKAIGARDIDRMEALGIYEVAPEDFALCEYVDPSKTEIQKLVREGLDWLRKETE